MPSQPPFRIPVPGKRAGLIALALGLAWWTGNNLERFLNRVKRSSLPAITPAARRLHDAALVVDLHADSLLMGRDLRQRSTIGHIDLPRLQDGNVALQVFAAATRIPIGFNVNRTPARLPDLLALAGLLQRSPQAWRSPLQRALHHAQRLQQYAARSGGQLHLIGAAAELEALLVQRQTRPYLVGALLAIEGTQALLGDPANVEPLFAAGYRILGLTHFYDTDFAGSAHGWRKGPLTARGRDLLARMTQLEMVLDVAHLAPRALDDVLALWTKPLLMSHGGVCGTYPNQRNLTDAQVKAIAASGGVIGIGFWPTAAGGRHPQHIIAAMDYVCGLVGDDHVALGSDYDGGILPAFDTSELAVLTQQMLDTGFGEATIRKILGGNALRLLRNTLPAGNGS